MAILYALACGIGGSLLLAVVYYGFEFQWPGTYRNLSDTFGLRITERLWRLVGFRAGPVFLAGILTWTIAHRVQGTAWLAVVVMLAIHISVTNGRAFVRSLTPGRPESALNYGSYHITAGLVAIAAGVASSSVAPFVQEFVPSRQALVDGFWSACLIATAAGFVLRIVGTDAPERNPRAITYLTARAEKDASIDVFDDIYTIASRMNSDPLVVKAFAIAEILQRPKWFRQAERVLGLLRPKGTYGVMQERADKPITDSESIRRFSARISSQEFFTFESSYLPISIPNRLWGLAGRHNGDKLFYDSVQRLHDGFLYKIDWVDEDANESPLGVVELRRYATRWGIRVVTKFESIKYYSDALDYSGKLEKPTGTSPSSWWYGEIQCPIEWSSIVLFPKGKPTGHTVELKVREDFG